MRAFAVHYTNPRYQGFMRHLGIAIMKYTRNPIKPNIEDAIMSLQTMIFSDYEEAGDKIKQVANSGIPLLIAFSENDRAINPEVIFNMVDLIGTRNQDLWLYDADGKLVRKGSTSGSRKVMLFKKGGHYLFRRHPEVVNSAVMELLQTALASSK
uniref:Serine carboxypeptidase n=2 Tax=Rhipicephalus TaxID=34630 RepID=A0A6M2CIW5_RHIMP